MHNKLRHHPSCDSHVQKPCQLKNNANSISSSEPINSSFTNKIFVNHYASTAHQLYTATVICNEKLLECFCTNKTNLKSLQLQFIA